ncbi:UNVERIFIED_CONTAM: pseudouridine synthase [Campylobacter lari]
MAQTRIEKYLTSVLDLSRSEIKKILGKKLVKVNDKIVQNGYKIDIEKDIIKVNNEVVKYEKFQYFMFNKPAGFICANSDDYDATVFDIVGLNKDKYFTFGRLDKDTEGLLIISNDGQMCHKLLCPKNHVPKKYFVKVDRIFNEKILN